MAVKAGPDAKLPTVRQLCQILDTSLQTLDEAMRNLEAQDVIARRQGSGVYVSSRVHYRSVAVLLDSLFFEQSGASPVWGMLWGLITREAQQRATFKSQTLSFHLIPSTHPVPLMQSSHSVVSDALPESLRRTIERKQLDGALSIGLSKPLLQWIDEYLPLVAFAGGARHRVELATTEVVRQATRCLALQGCRRIAFWRPAHPNPECEIEAFRQGLAEHGVAYYPDLMRILEADTTRPNGEPSETRQEQGRRVALEVFGNRDAPWPDGIVISDDMMTSGALSAMYKLRVWAGADVNIASHANVGSHVLRGYEEMITTVQFDPAEIVHTMFDMLETLMAAQDLPQEVVRLMPTVVLPSLD
jgi:DNA-binding LacI/PurR family transcriptional regulator